MAGCSGSGVVLEIEKEASEAAALEPLLLVGVCEFKTASVASLPKIAGGGGTLGLMNSCKDKLLGRVVGRTGGGDSSRFKRGRDISIFGLLKLSFDFKEPASLEDFDDFHDLPDGEGEGGRRVGCCHGSKSYSSGSGGGCGQFSCSI